jgi:hypothetical protein
MPIRCTIALFFAVGCAAEVADSARRTGSGADSLMDCSDPAAPLYCSACGGDENCISCIAGDRSACDSYCATNPESTVCVRVEDCVDAEGNCLRDKPGCYCLSDGSSGEGEVTPASDTEGGDDGYSDEGSGEGSSDDGYGDGSGDDGYGDGSGDDGYGDGSGDGSGDDGYGDDGYDDGYGDDGYDDGSGDDGSGDDGYDA